MYSILKPRYAGLVVLLLCTVLAQASTEHCGDPQWETFPQESEDCSDENDRFCCPDRQCCSFDEANFVGDACDYPASCPSDLTCCDGKTCCTRVETKKLYEECDVNTRYCDETSTPRLHCCRNTGTSQSVRAGVCCTPYQFASQGVVCGTDDSCPTGMRCSGHNTCQFRIDYDQQEIRMIFIAGLVTIVLVVIICAVAVCICVHQCRKKPTPKGSAREEADGRANSMLDKDTMRGVRVQVVSSQLGSITGGRSQGSLPAYRLNSNHATLSLPPHLRETAQPDDPPPYNTETPIYEQPVPSPSGRFSYQSNGSTSEPIRAQGRFSHQPNDSSYDEPRREGRFSHQPNDPSYDEPRRDGRFSHQPNDEPRRFHTSVSPTYSERSASVNLSGSVNPAFSRDEENSRDSDDYDFPRPPPPVPPARDDSRRFSRNSAMTPEEEDAEWLHGDSGEDDPSEYVTEMNVDDPEMPPIVRKI